MQRDDELQEWISHTAATNNTVTIKFDSMATGTTATGTILVKISNESYVSATQDTATGSAFKTRPTGNGSIAQDTAPTIADFYEQVNFLRSR